MRNRKSDIEKYLRGELSPSEMHALEKEALNDPFLSEALEGIEHAGADNFLYDLHRLNKSVHDRMRRKTRKSSKTIRMWGWTSAVAATLLLLAVSGFLVVKILKDQQARERSLNTAPDDTKDTAVKDSSAVTSADSSRLALIETEEPNAAESPGAGVPPLKKNGEKRTAVNESKPSGEVLGDVIPPAEDEDTLTGQTDDNAKKESSSVINPLARAEIREQDSLVRRIPDSQQYAARAPEGKVAGVETRHRTAVQTNTEVSGKVVGGKVTSEDGNVLPGVNVTIKGTNRGTVTEGAEPDGGKVDFKAYLANAVKYPQEALSNKTEGKVTVRFTVETNGKLTDFEVVKGIGSGCEEELIRAIQQGPYWKPGKRGEQPVKDKILVKFKFNLPR